MAGGESYAAAPVATCASAPGDTTAAPAAPAALKRVLRDILDMIRSRYAGQTR